MRTFLGLGSNIGDRLLNLKKANFMINNNFDIKIISKSKVYDTSPMEVINQDFFLNQVIEINTTIVPLELLYVIKEIEISMGRLKVNQNMDQDY